MSDVEAYLLVVNAAALTLLMVTQLGLGVSAAAWSTGIAQTIGLIVLGMWLAGRNHPLAPGSALLRAMVPDWVQASADPRVARRSFIGDGRWRRRPLRARESRGSPG